MNTIRRAACALTVTAVAALAPVAPAVAGTGPVSCRPAPPATVNLDVARVVYATGRQLTVSPTVMLAGFEAALVESRMNNCSNGDADSVGVFQQRPSWGTTAQRTDVAYASTQFFNRAKSAERPGVDAGKLAQQVQGSAYPDRYGQEQSRAQQLINQVAGLAAAPPALSTQTAGLTALPGSSAGWSVRGNGTVTPFGGAPALGSPNGALAAPVVGIVATPSGGGYWLVAADGGIFTFGDAGFYGSTGGMRLNQPVVGMAATPTGRGYWLVAADGGIFTFGDAGFYGSTGGMRLNQPVVGMAATPTGRGYWLVAADGGIFTFGDAPFRGAATGQGTATGMTRSASGYEVVLRDGRVLAY